MAPPPGIPDITLCNTDYEHLCDVAKAFLDKQPDIAEALIFELDRAHVVNDSKLSASVVRMGLTLRFATDGAEDRVVTLVYPTYADISKSKISIMTPIGVALIGLSVGQSIDWATRSGGKKRLTIDCVSNESDPLLAHEAWK
ncbi:nucleoside diphosphate kinase regulator [Hyphococcus luteus]|uniref:Nucleoside diphosphate kinase regulator n=1 Tax=Hyphococcus luteus TaxID=2058213 RepID=A0A2S7KB52_9PROT|nr:nucleoside diphosphate kinase regulator [Marinicaulis flavus]PQA89703.1 nucleoside diphosphate kinase regulator [Marinicaulis flavus]